MWRDEYGKCDEMSTRSVDVMAMGRCLNLWELLAGTPIDPPLSPSELALRKSTAMTVQYSENPVVQSQVAGSRHCPAV